MIPWSGVIAIEGVPTASGRLIDHDALWWSLPVPLMRPGFESDRFIGWVDWIERRGGKIHAGGVWQPRTSQRGLAVTVSVTVSDIEDVMVENQHRLLQGRIRDVTLTIGPIVGGVCLR